MGFRFCRKVLVVRPCTSSSFKVAALPKPPVDIASTAENELGCHLTDRVQEMEGIPAMEASSKRELGWKQGRTGCANVCTLASENEQKGRVSEQKHKVEESGASFSLRRSHSSPFQHKTHRALAYCVFRLFFFCNCANVGPGGHCFLVLGQLAPINKNCCPWICSLPYSL